MTRPIRVMVLASFADSLVNFRGPLLEDLVRSGCDVLAAAPPGDAALTSRLASSGVVFHPVPMNRAGMNPLRDIATYRALRRLFRATRPDVLLAYTVKPVVYGCLAARAEGVKRVVPLVTGLGYAFVGTGLRSRIARLIAGTLYRRAMAAADIAVFQNPDDQAAFRDLRILPRTTPSLVVNGSGVDLDHFPVQPLPAAPSFLMIGRLLREKGVYEYAEAVRMTKERHPGTDCRIAGWIDNAPSAIPATLPEQWKSTGGPAFLGRLDDVRPALADCSVYVLPSYREGTPRTVLEAMACGRAIITTDTPGCRETVQDGVNGFLVPVGDAAALAAAMERFHLDPGLAARMGAESRRIAEEKYDVHKVNRAMMSAMGITT